jgi:hypothetical protein
MSHAKQPPDAHACSGFAVITAPLPERLGWVIVWRKPCGCCEHVGPDLDAINAIMFRDGGIDAVSIATTQPLDPT